MKSFIILTLLCAGTNAISTEFFEKVMNELHAVAMACVKQESATANDMVELMVHKFPPSTHEAKCVIACFYEHYHMMTPEGTFDKQATIDAFNPLKSEDADLYDKMLKIF
ncbi:general odorant-binding protein 19d-like [Zophobas morio]|uniref:general odorant-binding protein 19d-like n=1 Tax=Zophobas morio TaxID=2755281 RepID=UPI003083E305